MKTYPVPLRLKVPEANPLVSSVPRGSVVPVTITGSGFAAGMQVSFENGSGQRPTAAGVTVVGAPRELFGPARAATRSSVLLRAESSTGARPGGRRGGR
jgi:hypothetical protein